MFDLYPLVSKQISSMAGLLRMCKKHLASTDEELITRAFKLCCWSHEDDKRASGEPYYLHPLEVAKIMAEDFNIDDVSVAAALLHDTVEDTDVTLEMIEELFRSEEHTSELQSRGHLV